MAGGDYAVRSVMREARVAKQQAAFLSAVGPARWSVRTLPWLPVVVDGNRRRVGLDEALLEAHRIERVDLPDPVTRAAVLSFLPAMTAVVLRAANVRPMTARALLASGLPPDAVAATLDRFDERLWLVHPEHPFLQEARFAGIAPNREAIALIPSVPGPSTKLWFGSNASRGNLDPADAVLALLAYWYFSPASNSRPKVDGEEVRSPGSVIGSSAFNSGVRAFAVGETLLETLLRNTLTSWVESPQDPCFLRDVRLLPIIDPFDVATASGNAALLLRESEDGPFTQVIAGGALRDGIPMSAAMRAERAEYGRRLKARQAEIKAVRSRNAERKRGHRGQPGEPDLEPVPAPLDPFDSPYDVLARSLKAVALESPNLVRVRMLTREGGEDPAVPPRPLTGFTFGQRLFDDLKAVFLDRRVIMPAASGRMLAAGRVQFEFFEVTYAGNAGPAQFESAAWHASGAELLELSQPARNALEPFATRLLDYRAKILPAIKMAFGGSQGASAPEGLVEAAEALLAGELAPLFGEAVDAVSREEDVPPELYDRAAKVILDTVKAVLRPYESVSRMADIARAYANLAGQLRGADRAGGGRSDPKNAEGTLP